MRLLKRVALALVVLAAVFLGVGMLLPSAWHTERSVEIAAGSEHILPLIETPARWEEWAPWNKTRYPDMQVEFAGEKAGAGAKWSWKGQSSGNGSMTITRASADYGIDFDLAFEGHEPSKGSIRLEPSAGGTKVTWSMWGDMGMSPIARYFGLVMDSMMAPDFEAGLGKLETRAKEEQVVAEKAAAEAKARAEAEAAAAAAAAAQAVAEEMEAAE
ncbi:SRPBCC family protein [Vulgatibacter sp.]|uniref:SRPBCC family protein n=1 Tax=Vulgatibacter sp. TaxID=1971226 RepID=UPI0035626FD4